MPRVTQGQIAAHLGIHKSSVSLALRNSPEVSPELRKQVVQAAVALGYQPDPVLAALSARRFNQEEHAEFSAILAYVYHDETLQEHPLPRRFDGATARARTLGYGVEAFNTAAYSSEKKATSVLKARGVAGLIVPGIFEASRQPQLDWEAFSGVNLGTGRYSPCYHSVLADNFQSVRLMTEMMRLADEPRPGFALFSTLYEVDELIHLKAACLLEQSRWKPAQRLPCLDQGHNRALFLEWFERYRPTAIITFSPSPCHWLQEMGLRIPDDVRLACLNLPSQGVEDKVLDKISGVVNYAEVLGTVAVEMLDKLIRSHEIGPPEIPTRLLVPPKVVERE